MAGTSTQILLNGNFHNETSALFNIFNRALRFGDCIVETIHACASRLCFFDEHMENLRKAMDEAQMNIPEKFYNRDKEFTAEIAKMLTKNRVFKGATIKIIVFRTDIAPNPRMADPVEYIAYIDHQSSSSLVYEFNTQGFYVDTDTQLAKGNGPMSNYRTHDFSIPRTMAIKKCRAANLNDLVFLNTSGNVAETAYGNTIFIMKDKVLMTPPLKDGCPADVMRTKVLEAAKSMGIPTNQDTPMTEETLRKADEMFLASTENGIQWVLAYKSRRFMRTTAQAIIQKINDMYSAEE